MPTSHNLSDLRKEYTLKELTIAATAPEPFSQFRTWLEEALQANVPEPSAMHLSTVSPEGIPSARVVLLKGLSKEGFVFYTNYQSRKGKELSLNPAVCLTFFWPELERQVRIEGKVQLTSPGQSDEYFHSRPRGSQLGALASPQSQVIENREVLEQKLSDLEKTYSSVTEIPRPFHWGGYIVVPQAVEFWQGRPSRLHDRILYQKKADGTWEKVRLAP